MQEQKQGRGPAPGFRGDFPLLRSHSQALPCGPKVASVRPGRGSRPCLGPWARGGAAARFCDPDPSSLEPPPGCGPGGARASLAGQPPAPGPRPLLAALRLGRLESNADARSPCPNPVDSGPWLRVGVACRPPASPNRGKAWGTRPGPARLCAGPAGRKKLVGVGVRGLSKFLGTFPLEIPQPCSAPYRKRRPGRAGAPHDPRLLAAALPWRPGAPAKL